MNGFCPLGKACEHEHPKFNDSIFLPIHNDLKKRYIIRKDYEINTRKMDEEKERRLNAILNGE